MKEQLNKLNQRLRITLSIMVLSICTIFLLLSNSATAQTNILVTNVPGVNADGSAANVTITATAENVYSISNVNELRALSHYVMNGGSTEGKVFNLTADIDFDALPTERNKVYLNIASALDNSTNFMPIGGWSRWINTSTPATDVTKIFKGAFNGNGHTIKGLQMKVSRLSSESPHRDYIGLFGMNAGTIMNVGLYTPDIQGHYSVGGICGENFGFIMNSYTVGNTIYGGQDVAGIAGYNRSASIITHCFSTSGAYAYESSAGGICGHNGGKLFTCYAAYGALVGTSEYYTTVENCYYNGADVNDSRYGTGVTDATLKSASFVNTLNTTPVSIKYIGERNYIIPAANVNYNYPVLDFTTPTPSPYTIHNGEEYIVPNGTSTPNIPSSIIIEDGGSLIDNSGNVSSVTIQRKLKVGAWNLFGLTQTATTGVGILNSNAGTVSNTAHDMAAVQYDYTTTGNTWNTGHYLGVNEAAGYNSMNIGEGYFVWPLTTDIHGTAITPTDVYTIVSQTSAPYTSNIPMTTLNLTNNGAANASSTGTGAVTGVWFSLNNPYTGKLKPNEICTSTSISNTQGESTVYTYNADNGAWEIPTYVYPGQGFMVASAANATTLSGTLTKTKRTAKSAETETTPSYITFTCQANNTTKEAFARISEQASNGFDNKDAYVLLSTNNEDLVEPYFLVENHANIEKIFKTMPYYAPMNFHASKVSNTNLTVSNIPNNVSVSIVDLSNGQETALENGSTFNFVANEGENEGRFVVKFGKTNVSIENTAEENEISLAMYPNPATTSTTLFVDGLTNDAQVFVNDVQGRTINTYTINNNQSTLKINTSNLASGVYYIRVVSNNLTKTEKLIVK
jgi:hypothetical protein